MSKRCPLLVASVFSLLAAVVLSAPTPSSANGGEADFVRRGPFAGLENLFESAELIEYTNSQAGSTSPGTTEEAFIDFDPVDERIEWDPARSGPGLGKSGIIQGDVVDGHFLTGPSGFSEVAIVEAGPDNAIALRIARTNLSVAPVVDDGLTPHVLPEVANPWTRDQFLTEGTRVARPNRTLKLAAGQLDDDDFDEVVLAYWNVDSAITLAVYDVDLITGFEDPVLLSGPAVPFSTGLGTPAELADTNNVIEVATGDFDGDLVDEIALILPVDLHPDPCPATDDCGWQREVEVHFFKVEVGEGGKTIEPRGTIGPLDMAGANYQSRPELEYTFVGAIEARSGRFNVTQGSFAGIVPEELVVGTQFVRRFPDRAENVGGTVGINVWRNETFGSLRTLVLERCPTSSDFCLVDSALATLNTSNGAFGLASSVSVTNFAEGSVGSTTLANIGISVPIPKTSFCFDVGNVDDDALDEVVFYGPIRPNSFALRVFDGSPPAMGMEIGSGLTLTQTLANQALIDSPVRPFDDAIVGFTAAADNLNDWAVTGYNLFSISPPGDPRNQQFPERQTHCELVVADVESADVDGSEPDRFLPEIFVDFLSQERVEPTEAAFNRGVLALDSTGRGYAQWAVTLLEYELSSCEDGVCIDALAPVTRASGVEGFFPFPQFFRQVPRFSRLAAGDLDLDRVRLGVPPAPRRIDILQPLVYVAAPPTHFDVLPGGAGAFDPGGCYQGSSCGGFGVTYQESQMSTIGFEAEIKAGFSLSDSAGIKVSGFGAGIENSYGRDFTLRGGSTETFTITQERSASLRDQVLAADIGYTVWEYPILDGFSPSGDELVVYVPDRDGERFFTFDSTDAGVDSIRPRHEPGNLFSYRPSSEIPATVIQEATGFRVDDESSNQVSVTFTNATDSLSMTGTSFETTAQLGAEVPIKLLTVNLSTEGTYEVSTLTSSSASLSESQEISFSSGTVAPQSQYDVTPYVLWDESTLVLDYAVDFPAGLNSADFDPYRQQPDLALNLPRRLHVEKGFLPAQPDPETSPLFETRSLSFFPSRPEPGEDVFLYARVYNMSLVPSASQTRVAFYDGHPERGGTEIASALTNPIGIEAQGVEVVRATWQVPAEADPETLQIFVELEPQGGAPDLRDDNNLGWRALDSSQFVPEPSGASAALVVLATMFSLARRRGECSASRTGCASGDRRA